MWSMERERTSGKSIQIMHSLKGEEMEVPPNRHLLKANWQGYSEATEPCSLQPFVKS